MCLGPRQNAQGETVEGPIRSRLIDLMVRSRNIGFPSPIGAHPAEVLEFLKK